MNKHLVVLGLALLLLTSCRDMHFAPIPEVLRGRCAGEWVAAPLNQDSVGLRPARQQLQITIDRLTTSAGGVVAGAGTVAWGDVAWPMSIENQSGYPFCRYGVGHPFSDSTGTDGFRFRMLQESGRDPQYDQLFIDFDQVGSQLPHGLESDWYCYERKP